MTVDTTAELEDVRAQFARPAFSRVTDLHLGYLPYSQFSKHRKVSVANW